MYSYKNNIKTVTLKTLGPRVKGSFLIRFEYDLDLADHNIFIEPAVQSAFLPIREHFSLLTRIRIVRLIKMHLLL